MYFVNSQVDKTLLQNCFVPETYYILNSEVNKLLKCVLSQGCIVFVFSSVLCQQHIVFSSVLILCQQRIVCANSASDGTNCENLQANRIVNNIERHYSVDGLQFHVLVKLISFKKSICTRQQQYRAQLLKRLVIFCLGIFYFLKYICPGQYLRAPLFTH